MAAPWSLWTNPLVSSLFDSLWLSPGDPVLHSFLFHFGSGFGTHFGVDLERLKLPKSSKKVYSETQKEGSEKGSKLVQKAVERAEEEPEYKLKRARTYITSKGLAYAKQSRALHEIVKNPSPKLESFRCTLPR